MAYEIYTYGNGEILSGVFKAIAMCLKKDGGTLYEAMIRLGMIVGVMWAVVYAIYGDIVKLFSSWILPLSVFNIMLFTPTATIWIHDPITNFHEPMDNVPYGLAVFASYTSRIGYAITEQVEKVFSLPDDIKYQKTGHIFASNLIQKVKTLQITNEEVAENMRQFVGHCVAYDALLGRKYTIQDLRNSSDIWGLVSSNASPVRSFLWKEPRGERGGGAPSIITCKSGIAKFNQLWTGEITRAATLFGKKMFGNNGIIDAKTQLLQSLPVVYRELGNMAQGATDILKQQMMINSVVDGIDQQSTAVGNASNFAARRAYLHQRSTYETLGAMAGDTLPIMKAVLEAIAYSVFIFIVPLALLPFGWKFMASWGQIVLWLQMWAPLYAILNYIMTMAAKAKTLTAMSLSNEAGVTIASSVGIANANADISAMAGYLAMSIPFLCIAIVKGVGSFVTMASHLGNVSQGSASMAAGEATSGNYSFGNISEGNSQIANTNMLQQSHAASYRSGSFQHADGRTDMITSADGSQIMNVSSSNLPVSLNGSVSESAQKTEMQNHTWQQGISNSQASSQNIANSIRNSASLNESIRASENAGNSVSQGISTEQSQALSKSQQYVTDFAKQHNINEDKAASLFAEASINGGFFLKGAAGGRTSVNSSDQNTLQDAEKVVNSQDYQQSLRASAQAAKSLSHTLTDEKTRNLAADVAGSYEKGMQQRQEAAKNFSDSKSYGLQAASIRANSAAINQKYDQQFVEWLANQKADNTNGTIGKHGVAHIVANDPDATNRYAQRFMQEKGLLPSSPVTYSPASIQQGYHNETRHQPLAPINDAPVQAVQQAAHSLTQNHSLAEPQSPANMPQSPAPSGGGGSYGTNDHTSSMPMGTSQQSYTAPSGQGVNYPGASQGTPSSSGGGSYETHSGGQVTSSPTASMAGGTGSYRPSDQNSPMPMGTSQQSYTAPSGQGVSYSGTSQETPSTSEGGSAEAYSGTKVTSATAPVTVETGSYGTSDQTSSTLTGAAQPTYTPPSGQAISYPAASQGTSSLSGSDNAEVYSGTKVTSATAPVIGGNGNYGGSYQTSSLPTATTQPSYTPTAGQGISYLSSSQGTPSTSGGGNYEAYSGTKVTSTPTTPMTGGSGSYGTSDQTSSLPMETAQPTYTAPSGRNILFSDSNIPISQTGADFRTKVEGNINNTHAEIQQGQNRIEQKSNPIKQEIKDEKGKMVTARVAKKAINESIGTAKDVANLLPDPSTSNVKPQFLKDLD